MVKNDAAVVPAGTEVRINTDQTTKEFGVIIRVEYDPIWGPQYYTRVYDYSDGKPASHQYYWLQETEIVKRNSYR